MDVSNLKKTRGSALRGRVKKRRFQARDIGALRAASNIRIDVTALLTLPRQCGITLPQNTVLYQLITRTVGIMADLNKALRTIDQ